MAQKYTTPRLARRAYGRQYAYDGIAPTPRPNKDPAVTSEARARTGNRGAACLKAILVALVVLLPATAQGNVELRPFSNEEWAALDEGRAVERRFELPHRGAKYLAAVSYARLNQPCSQLTPLLEQPARHFAGALPATREVRPLEQRDGLTRLRVVHGNATMQGEWTALYRMSDDGHTGRFWLDTNDDRDVEDVFGFFRLSPWKEQTCLVSAVVAVDPGDGLLASLFRSMIHNYLVRSAARIQRYVRSVELSLATSELANQSALPETNGG